MAGLRAADVAVAPDGQSLNLTPGGGITWPELFCAALHCPTPIDLEAGGGYNATRLLNKYQKLVQRHAHAARRTIYTLCGGTTDIQGGRTAAQIYADMVTLADNARGWGYRYIIATTITPSNLFSGPQETVRLAANVLILADAEDAFDAVSDFAAAPLDDHTDTTYYSDGLHFTADGAQAAADMMLATYEAMTA